MSRTFSRSFHVLALATLALVFEWFAYTPAASGQEPVYQQRSNHADHWQHRQKASYRNRYHWHNNVRASTQEFSFQRPYPYHLDYYRMRYGGSYAPYFGNLYGPSQVYAPAYGYGGFGGNFFQAPQAAPLQYGQPHAAPFVNPGAPSEAVIQQEALPAQSTTDSQ